MQKKIGILLDNTLVRKAKEMATSRNTTLNRVFEEVLTEYFFTHARPRKRLSGVETTFGALKLSPKIVHIIVQGGVG